MFVVKEIEEAGAGACIWHATAVRESRAAKIVPSMMPAANPTYQASKRCFNVSNDLRMRERGLPLALTLH